MNETVIFWVCYGLIVIAALLAGWLAHTHH